MRTTDTHTPTTSRISPYATHSGLTTNITDADLSDYKQALTTGHIYLAAQILLRISGVPRLPTTTPIEELCNKLENNSLIAQNPKLMTLLLVFKISYDLPDPSKKTECSANIAQLDCHIRDASKIAFRDYLLDIIASMMNQAGNWALRPKLQEVYTSYRPTSVSSSTVVRNQAFIANINKLAQANQKIEKLLAHLKKIYQIGKKDYNDIKQEQAKQKQTERLIQETEIRISGLKKDIARLRPTDLANTPVPAEQDMGELDAAETLLLMLSAQKESETQATHTQKVTNNKPHQTSIFSWEPEDHFELLEKRNLPKTTLTNPKKLIEELHQIANEVGQAAIAIGHQKIAILDIVNPLTSKLTRLRIIEGNLRVQHSQLLAFSQQSAAELLSVKRQRRE